MNLTYFFIFNLALISNAYAALAVHSPSPYRQLVSKHGTLCDAVKSGDYYRVQTLINFFYDTNAQDHLGNTPLHWAVASDNECVTRLLVEHGAFSLPNASGITPLHIAARMSNQVLLGVLLQHGASLEYKDGAGHTPLYYAARYGDYLTVAFLLDKGASGECISLESLSNEIIKNMIKFYPQLLAASCSDVRAVNKLLSKGAEFTPLMMSNLDLLSEFFSAVERKSASGIKLLVDRGACVNAKDIHGDTALDKAIKLGDENLIGILRGCGAIALIPAA